MEIRWRACPHKALFRRVPEARHEARISAQSFTSSTAASAACDKTAVKVLKTRDEGRRGRKHQCRLPEEMTLAGHLVEDGAEDRCELEKGREFTQGAGNDLERPLAQVDDERSQRYHDVPADDDENQPDGDGTVDGEGDEGGYCEKLVGHGIEETPETALMGASPGRNAVEDVCNAGEAEDGGRPEMLLIDEQSDEKRDEKNAAAGQQVRNIHGVRESAFPVGAALAVGTV